VNSALGELLALRLAVDFDLFFRAQHQPTFLDAALA